MIVAVCVAKGSSGATTTALALGASWPVGHLVAVAECDVAGGDVAARFGLAQEPGVMTATGTVRPLAFDALLEHAQVLPGGLRVLPGPVAAEEASAVAVDAARAVCAGVVDAPDATLIVDCGRVVPPRLPPAIGYAATVVVVVRQMLRSAPASVGVLAHAQELVDALTSAGRATALVLIGDHPYPRAEVERFLGVEVLGVLDDDAIGAAFLAGRAGTLRASGRTALLRSARPIAARLVRHRPNPEPAHAPPLDVVSEEYR